MTIFQSFPRRGLNDVTRPEYVHRGEKQQALIFTETAFHRDGFETIMEPNDTHTRLKLTADRGATRER